jgi:hypothetical protein
LNNSIKELHANKQGHITRCVIKKQNGRSEPKLSQKKYRQKSEYSNIENFGCGVGKYKVGGGTYFGI